MATEVQPLFDEGNCFACFGPLTQVEILRLTLLSRIVKVLVPSVDTTPQALLEQGDCLACYGMSLAQIMELTLLGLVAANISGGGGGTSCPPVSGIGTPQGTVTPDCIGQTYVDLSVDDMVYVSNGLTSADWLAVNYPNVRGPGSPIGIVTPYKVGDLYTNTSTVPRELWQATGLTNNDWEQLT